MSKQKQLIILSCFLVYLEACLVCAHKIQIWDTRNQASLDFVLNPEQNDPF